MVGKTIATSQYTNNFYSLHLFLVHLLKDVYANMWLDGEHRSRFIFPG